VTVLAAGAFAVAAACSAATGEAQKAPLVLLWTGETHAMLEPCECPLRPEGGLARRAAAISAELRSGCAILVDAGGWAAGGLYDEYTEGAEADRLRSEATVRAMALMGYDAVAVSDEELLDGGELIARLAAEGRLPLVSANLVERATGKAFLPAFRVVERGGWKVGIVGLTTTGLDVLAPAAAARFDTTDPAKAAREAVRQARESGAEAIVLLSPLGEEASERLAREVERADIVINAHRRSTASPFFHAGGVPVLQFDFQGRSLLRAELGLERGKLRLRPLDPISLGPELPDEPGVAGIVREAKAMLEALAARRVLPVEVFKMALCPYASAVEKTIAEAKASLGPRLDVRVTQVVRRSPRGELQSLRGRAELEEARRQAAIFEFYPDRYWSYAEWRAASPFDADWELACRRLGMSASRLKGAIASGEADQLLARCADRVERLRIEGSPVLYLGGRRYDGPHERGAILRAICAALPGRRAPHAGAGSEPPGAEAEAICKGLPACFSDADCRRPGFVGECVEPGTPRAVCVHHPAVRVPLTVVEDGSAVYSPSSRIVDSLRVFFPGLVVTRVEYRSAEGEALARLHKLERLPAYILGREALSERKIEGIREAFVPSAAPPDRSSGKRPEPPGGSLILEPRLAGSHQDLTRERVPGLVDIFLAPHSTAAAEALDEVLRLAAAGDAPPVRLRSAVYRDAEGRLAAPGGLAELETMLRDVAVHERWPEKLEAYLRARLARVGSSYWQDPLLACGLDPAEVRAAAELAASRAFLDADAQELAELGAGGPVVLLVSNQELVPVLGRAELRHALAEARELAQAHGRPAPLEGARGAGSPFAAPTALGRLDRTEAARLLVRAIGAVPEGARARIAEDLAALTGADLGPEPAAWAAWAAGALPSRAERVDHLPGLPNGR